jgi:predicted DNA-binding protein (MmcQ/YjbR family)
MNVEELRNYVLRMPGVTESLPFGPDVLVFKVVGKMFLLIDLNSSDLRLSVKTKPKKSLVLREKYEGIIPGYHLNKKHWNTIEQKLGIPPSLIYRLIDESYDLVVKNLSQKQQNKIKRI